MYVKNFTVLSKLFAHVLLVTYGYYWVIWLISADITKKGLDLDYDDVIVFYIWFCRNFIFCFLFYYNKK